MCMENVKGWVAWLALLGVVLLGIAQFWSSDQPQTQEAPAQYYGAAGNLLAESYLPYVTQNGGYNSAKAITTTDTVTGGDLAATDDLTVTDDATITDDLTVNGGTFTLTTTNAATSSAVMGCVQTYATSTETPIRLLIGSVATTSASHTGNNSAGHVLWGYGSCPI